MEKQKMRERMRQCMRSLDLDAIRTQSEAASARAAHTAPFCAAQLILCYSAMRREADPIALVRAAYAANKRVAFPYCLPDYGMLALEPLDANAWETGAFGIRTPILEQSRIVAPQELELVVVPGMAFDKMGGRLGRGAGYYDRFLVKTDAPRMGFCLSQQIVGQVPADAHDLPMHMVVTDRETLLCIERR